MIKLTEKQKWMLNYIESQSPKHVSPTEVGRAYGEYKGKKGYHSSIASPTLIKLSEMGLIGRGFGMYFKIQ